MQIWYKKDMFINCQCMHNITLNMHIHHVIVRRNMFFFTNLIINANFICSNIIIISQFRMKEGM